MVFLLNVLFISAACVFALSNSWSILTTTKEPVGVPALSASLGSSYVSPGVALQASPLGMDILTYIRGGATVRMPGNVGMQSPVTFLSNQSPFSIDFLNESFCPPEGCAAEDSKSPNTPIPGGDVSSTITSSSSSPPPQDEMSPLWRRLAAVGEGDNTSSDNSSFSYNPSSSSPISSLPIYALLSDQNESPGQRGASFWLVADSVELFFYLVILHHNTGLLFQNCILVDILLLTTCLTFILTAAISTSNTIG